MGNAQTKGDDERELEDALSADKRQTTGEATGETVNERRKG